MNYLSHAIFTLIVILKINAGYAGEAHNIQSIQQRVQMAENNADVSLLENLFTDGAVYLNPEGPPLQMD